MNFITEPLSELLINFDSKRIPLSSRERECKKGIYPYYGATSVLDYVDEYIFDGTYILLGEDGTVINADGSPVLQLANGKFWCNNHAHILKNTDKVDFYFLYYLLKNCNVSSIVTGAVQPKISQKNLYYNPYRKPPIYRGLNAKVSLDTVPRQRAWSKREVCS